MADNKLEREIDEIIKQTGDLPPPPRAARRSARRTPRPQRKRGPSVNPSQLMLASIALLLVGMLLWNASSGIGATLALTAIVLFLVSYALFFSKRSMGPGGYEKRWRGQTIVDQGPPPLIDRLRAWLSRLRR
jgi:hypothetical protein